jgi:hypothetical protein
LAVPCAGAAAATAAVAGSDVGGVAVATGVGEAAAGVGGAVAGVGDAAVAVVAVGVDVGDAPAGVGDAAAGVGAAAVAIVAVGVGDAAVGVGDGAAGVGDAAVGVGDGAAGVGETDDAVSDERGMPRPPPPMNVAPITMPSASSAEPASTATAQIRRFVQRVAGCARVDGGANTTDIGAETGVGAAWASVGIGAESGIGAGRSTPGTGIGVARADIGSCSAVASAAIAAAVLSANVSGVVGGGTGDAAGAPSSSSGAGDRRGTSVTPDSYAAAVSTIGASGSFATIAP